MYRLFYLHAVLIKPVMRSACKSNTIMGQLLQLLARPCWFG